MIVNEPRELLMVLEHAHRYMDANGYPARSYPPSFATAELMKEPTVTVVSDLFDNPRRLTEDGEPYSRAHGTHGGVSRHHRNSETLCDECGAFIATLHRTKRREKRDEPTEPTPPARMSPQDEAKALTFHRMERAKLQASLTPEERARLASTSGMAAS